MKGKEVFRGPELKLQRAETHIIELRVLVRRFVKAQVYKIVADFERDPGYICWVVHGEDLFPHDEFAPIIGDVIHNLRDALDLAVSVIMRNAQESDDNVYFPTADTPNAFKRKIARGKRKPHFPHDLVNVLETRIQPYKGGEGHLLHTLHKLAITDKHRMIVPTVFGTTDVAISTEGMTLPFYTGATPLPIRDGGVFARTLASEFPQITVNQEATVTLSISFYHADRLDVLPIDDALRWLYRVTEEAVDAMRLCL